MHPSQTAKLQPKFYSKSFVQNFVSLEIEFPNIVQAIAELLDSEDTFGPASQVSLQVTAGRCQCSEF